jgi:hypothetical protein
MMSLPASSLSDDSGKGTMRRQWITCSTWLSVCSGFQSRLSVFTHTSPATEMLGWKIFVRKKAAEEGAARAGGRRGW